MCNSETLVTEQLQPTKELLHNCDPCGLLQPQMTDRELHFRIAELSKPTKIPEDCKYGCSICLPELSELSGHIEITCYQHSCKYKAGKIGHCGNIIIHKGEQFCSFHTCRETGCNKSVKITHVKLLIVSIKKKLVICAFFVTIATISKIVFNDIIFLQIPKIHHHSKRYPSA